MTAVSVPEAVATDQAATSKVGLILKVRELGIFIALIALVGYTALSNSRFLESQSIKDILLGTAVISVLATGQAVVVITRNIDLSVGSVLGLSAFATATLMHNKSSTPVAVALLFGLAIGLACGLVNGALVRFGNAPSLVVTLGTLYVFRGISFIWAGGHEINADELPDPFLAFGTSAFLGIPYLVIVAVVVLVIADVFMRSYSTGRDLYAMGSNPEAARLAGVPVGRRTLQAFMFSGALAGLAGVLFAARFGTIGATAGRGAELNVVAAVVVGGIAVFGGSGNVYGAALGALLLTVIGSSLAVLNINQFWQQAIVGSLILIAIGTDRVVASRVSAALRTRDVSHGS